VHDDAGRPSGLEGTLTVVTERKRAELAVHAEKERAQVTLQSIGDAVITTDAAGVIDYVNPIAEQLTGWRFDEARAHLDAVTNAMYDVMKRRITRTLLEKQDAARGTNTTPASTNSLVPAH
jgi:PAS domain-containing protein